MSKPLFASMLATFVATGCGDYNFAPIPACTKNQVLTGDGKALKCVDQSSQSAGGGADAGGMQGQPDMSQAQLSVPSCAVGKCLTGDNNGQLQCVDVSMTNQTLSQELTDVMNLQMRVGILEKNQGQGGGQVAMYRGVTKTLTIGRIAHANADIGIASAAAFCTDEFGMGAHMCTTYEMYMSVVTGKINSNITIPKSWVYAPSWQNPMNATNAALGGMSDNCAGYTYPTNDQKWTGLAVEWKLSPSANAGNASVLWWHGGSEAPCNINAAMGGIPIACCK